MSFWEFLVWLLGGVFISAFVICLIVFMIAFMWGSVEDFDEEQEGK